MASEIRVNKINSRTGVGTITLSPTGVDFTGIATVATLKATTGIVTTLTVTGNGTVGGTLGVTGDVDVADKIVHTGDTNTAIRFPAADTITAETAGSERLRITSDGKVGINTDMGGAPASLYPFSVYRSTGTGYVYTETAQSGASAGLRAKAGTADFTIFTTQGTGQLAVYDNTNSAERLKIDSSGKLKLGSNTLVTPNTDADNFVIDTGDVDSGISILSATTGRIYFGDAGSNDQGSIRYVHSDDSMRFETNSSERLRILSGGGITFNGDTATANALDDYEEGTYTPTFTCTSGSITLNGSYNIMSYEKIGNCCHVHGRVRVSSVSSPSGALTIGLPFTRSNPGEDSGRIGGSCVVQSGSSAVINYIIHPTGATGVEIARGDTSSIDTTVADNFSGDELVYIAVTYRTA